MPRVNQTKLCWSVVVKIGEDTIHEGDYISLRDVAEDLNLTYQQVADISVGRKKFNSKFKYQPKVEIKKKSLVNL